MAMMRPPEGQAHPNTSRVGLPFPLLFGGSRLQGSKEPRYPGDSPSYLRRPTCLEEKSSPFMFMCVLEHRLLGLSDGRG